MRPKPSIKKIDALRLTARGPEAEKVLLDRLRAYFLELSHATEAEITLTYHFPGTYRDPISLYLSVDGGSRNAKKSGELLDYTDQYFDMIRLTREPLSEVAWSRLEAATPHAYRFDIQGTGGALLVPHLPLSLSPIAEMCESLYHLKTPMLLSLRARAVEPSRAACLLPALHSLDALIGLNPSAAESLSSSMGHPYDEFESFNPLQGFTNYLWQFFMEIRTSRKLDNRLQHLIHAGVGHALSGSRLVSTPLKDANGGKESSPKKRQGGSWLEGMEGHVHASNLPLLFQFPCVRNPTTLLPVEEALDLPAALGLFRGDIKLGLVQDFGKERELRITDQDLSCHAFVVGKTGTGKSTLLKSMIASAIEENNQAVFVLDPHGDLVEDLLRWMPAKQQQRVVHVDFSDLENPPGLNIFEVHSDAEREFVIGETDQMFLNMYGADIWGPRIQDAYRNLATLLCLKQEGRGTLPDMLWMLESLEDDDKFEAFKRLATERRMFSTCLFLDQVRRKRYGDGSLAELTAYFRAKFSPFSDSPYLKNILGQRHSTLDFRGFIKRKNVCLFNLAKGRMSSRYSSLLGTLLTTKLFHAALSSTEIPFNRRPASVVFMDEFQNFVSPTLQDILSEARKFKLRLVLANQFLSQVNRRTALDKGQVDLLDAITGNVGSLIAFRLSLPDAERIQGEFGPPLEAQQIASLPNWHAIGKISQNGQSLPPFTFRTDPLRVEEDPDGVARMRASSVAEYCRPRAEVEEEIWSESMRFSGRDSSENEDTDLTGEAGPWDRTITLPNTRAGRYGFEFPEYVDPEDYPQTADDTDAEEDDAGDIADDMDNDDSIPF